MNEETTQVPKLVLLSGKDRGKELLLTVGGLVIGRTTDADLVVKDKSISRRHAVFIRVGSGWSVRDLGSKNGVRVNNRETKEQGLRTGDVVTVGGVKMKFIDPAELAAPPEPAPGPAADAPPPVPFPPPASGPQEPHAPFHPASPVPPPSVDGGFAQGPQWQPPGQPPAIRESAPPPVRDEYAPPPEFFAPSMPKHSGGPARKPLTRSMLMVYLAVFGAIGLGLGYLVYVTFFVQYEPFREDLKLDVDQVRLLDMAEHAWAIRAAQLRIESPRIASASYDPGTGILEVTGLSLGNTEVIFTDETERALGAVGVHVLKGSRKKEVDRTALTEEQLKTKARELMTEGDSLGEAHLAEAIAKFQGAVELLEWVTDDALKAVAVMRLNEFEREREKRFQQLKDRYRQANKLSDFAMAKDLLDEIRKLYPDPADKNHQLARIFLQRIEKREKARRAGK